MENLPNPEISIEPVALPNAAPPAENAVKFDAASYARARFAEKGLIAGEPAKQPNLDDQMVSFQGQEVAPPVAVETGAPARDPETGKFVKRDEPVAEVASVASDKATEATGSEPLVDLPAYGIKLPLSQAMAVFDEDRRVAAQHLQSERQRLESEFQAKLAEAREKEQQAQNIIALYQQNPNALAALLGGDTSGMGGGHVTPQPQESRSTVTLEDVQRLLEEREKTSTQKAAQEAEKRGIEERFNTSIEEGVTSVIAKNEFTDEANNAIRDLIGFWMARDRAANKLNPFSPAIVLKAQAQEYARKARAIISADHASKVERQAAVTKAAPAAIVGGNTSMPKSSSQDEFFAGRITPDKIRNRIFDTIKANASARGASM